jgi:hypothetical protein
MPPAPRLYENTSPNTRDGVGPVKPGGRSPLGPTPSVSANFRSGLYVDSCDATELDLGRKPISEVNESAGVQLCGHAVQSPHKVDLSPRAIP